MKVLEKGGTKLVDLLHKANPWAGQNVGETDACYVPKRRRKARRTAKTAQREIACAKPTACTQRQDREI